MGKCRVCGAPHKACGPASTVIPIDSRITSKEQTVGLKRYDVVVPGRREHSTTLLLSDEDAKRQGLDPAKDAVGAKPAEPKARTPRNKAAKPPANKAVQASATKTTDASE